MIEQDGLIGVAVSSGFGHNTRRPYVQVLIEAADWSTQMSPATARELAFNLLTCADAAESDGFLVGFLREVIGADKPAALAGVLVQFREYRAELQRAYSAEAQRAGDPQ